jgi:hypothetical protein
MNNEEYLAAKAKWRPGWDDIKVRVVACKWSVW